MTTTEDAPGAEAETFVGQFYRAYGRAAVPRPASLPRIRSCTHPGERWYNEAGLGPLCRTCGVVVYTGARVIQRHTQLRSRKPAAAILEGVHWLVLVVLAWGSLAIGAVKRWLTRPVSHQIYAGWWLIAIYCYVYWTTAAAGYLTLDPTTPLDWASFIFNVVLTALCWTLVLGYWADILPRWPVHREARPAGA